MASFQQLAAELAITIANRDVWLSIGLGLLLGGGCLVFGIVGGPIGRPARIRRPGRARRSASASAPGSWCWPRGGPRSGPVGGARSPRWPSGSPSRSPWPWSQRARRPAAPRPDSAPAERDGADASHGNESAQRRSLVLTALAGGVFVVAVALLYGSTMTLSPRDGVQPIEKTDVAFYAVLGKGLAASGTEMNTFTSGFSDLPGVTGADVVPLGRAVARLGRHRDLRDRLVGRPLSRRLALAAARRRRAHRHARAAHERHRLPAGLPVRVPRLPPPRAGPRDRRPVLQHVGERPDLWDRRLRAGRRRGPVRPVSPCGDGHASGPPGRSPASPAARSPSSCRRTS